MFFIAASVPEIATGLAVLLTAFGGVLAIIAKKESYSVKVVTEGLQVTVKSQQETIDRQEDEIRQLKLDLRDARQETRDEREEVRKLRTILNEKGIL